MVSIESLENERKPSEKNFAVLDHGDIRSTQFGLEPIGNKSSIIHPKKDYICGLSVIIEDTITNEASSKKKISSRKKIEDDATK